MATNRGDSSNESVKVVILCGGQGTRLREETEYRPKPLVEIGNRPILWHIMKTYAHFGYSEFLLALGYKGESIKQYFLNYHLLNSNFRLHLGSKKISWIRREHDENDWQINFVDTGQFTMTGGRVKRLEPYLKDVDRFMLTYGDGVTDLDVRAVLEFHDRSGCAVTVTGVRPLARFGEIVVDGSRAIGFIEKPDNGDTWINGGYFVMSPRIFDYIAGDETLLEREPLERLAAAGELAVYKHGGYWQCMDTLRDMHALNDQWARATAPWKHWDK